MVIVSTKIKRAAARAYDRETIDKEDFRLEKPNGFLYPLNSDSEFEFEAYSKNYGDKSTRNIWRARIRLRSSDGINVRKSSRDFRIQTRPSFPKKCSTTCPIGKSAASFDLRNQKTRSISRCSERFSQASVPTGHTSSEPRFFARSIPNSLKPPAN